MKKIEPAQIATLIANIGVIAGIVFLGFELHQNNQLLDAEARTNRAEFLWETHRLPATDEELASLILKAGGADELTELEAYQINEFWLGVLFNFELAHSQMPEDELRSSANRFRGYFATRPDLRNTWANESGRFSSEFANWVDNELVSQ